MKEQQERQWFAMNGINVVTRTHTLIHTHPTDSDTHTLHTHSQTHTFTHSHTQTHTQRFTQNHTHTHL